VLRIKKVGFEWCWKSRCWMVLKK